MFRKALSFAGMVLVAVTAVFMTPAFGLARGGGHFSGGHFSGGHFGGAGLGGGHGGFYHRGYSGAYHSGYPHTYGYPSYGYRHPHYPYLDYYPGYGYSDSYPGSYGTYPDVGSSPASDSGYYGSYGDLTPSYPDSDPSEPDNSASVTVNVPAGARVWFDDKVTTSTGPVRQFDSPPLQPGSRYSYDIRARWRENGHDVIQTQRVKVTAGAHVSVRFPVPAKTAAQAPAVKKG